MNDTVCCESKAFETVIAEKESNETPFTFNLAKILVVEKEQNTEHT